MPNQTPNEENPELPLQKAEARDLPDWFKIDGNTLRDTRNGNKPVVQCRPGHNYDI